jgi:hypothetical protein
MGEERAARESIACNNPADAVFRIDNHPHVALKIACLYNSFGDKFICVHNDASGYIAFRFGHTLGEALMIKQKGNNGEMSTAA